VSPAGTAGTSAAWIPHWRTGSGPSANVLASRAPECVWTKPELAAPFRKGEGGRIGCNRDHPGIAAPETGRPAILAVLVPFIGSLARTAPSPALVARAILEG